MSKVKVEKIIKEHNIEDDINLEEEKEVMPKELTAEEILTKLKSREKESSKEAVSYDFGIVALGHGGGRLGEELYSLGYSTIVINTATQDLVNIKVPEENKIFLDIGIQGAAKDLSRGELAFSQYREEIYNKIDDALGSCKVIIVCSSLGGGSGAGGLPVVIDLLQNVGKPIIVLAILPMVSEDVNAKSNSIETLSKLTKYVSNGSIHNLIVVDNARIESIYEGVGQMDFYKVANKAIVEPLHVFNKFSMKPSDVKPLDSAEFGTMLLNGEGLGIYGQITLENYDDEYAIANAVFKGLEGNLLASGFDLKEAKYAGFMIMANKDVWKKIPAGAINYAATMADDVFGNPIFFKGIYEDDSLEDVVKIYSFATGLGLPKARIDNLKADVSSQEKMIKTKDEDRKKKLVLETSKDEAVSDVDKIKQRIAAKSKGFGKLNDMIVDRRKR